MQLHTSSPQGIVSRAQVFVLAVCLAAGLKILFFSVALPFFPLDEELHFDAIHKFARGYSAQRELPGFDPDSAEIIELYHSPEFLKAPLPGMPFTPLAWWCKPTDEHLPPQFAYRVNAWMELKNVEINAPPVYYGFAAAWYKLGRLLGYSGIFLLYWLRGLNALSYTIFVLLSWLFVKECYPDNSYLQISVPLLLLVFPQDALLFMIPNTLFAPFVALCLLLLARLLKNPSSGMVMYLATGFVAACTALLGFGNFVVAIPLLVAAWLILQESQSNPNRGGINARSLAMLATAALPVGAWLARNRLVLGDWSGSRSKQQYLSWSIQPLSQVLHHPLFTWSGAGYFFSTLSRNFWRGEMFWHFAPRTAWIDPFYLWSSVLFGGVFAFYLLLSRKVKAANQRFADISSLAMVVGSVIFLMAISLPFDFGHCFYPSRARPYFVSGRLILGALLPFAILFLRGLQIICERILSRINPLGVALAIIVLIFVTETVLFVPMLDSRFNLISLLMGRSCG
jgi:hypothetical protein